MSADRSTPSIQGYEDALAAYHDSRQRYSPSSDEPILVWPWQNAPEALRALSRHGGDEDWVGVVPPNSWGVPMWMESGTSFGCCDVDHTELPGGYIVCIGAHA